MLAMLLHRGPDGFGLYLDDSVGLANTRLSIVGLEDGFQPLRNEDGTVWLSANGEIFNHLELRRALVSRGHRFATGSDCEAIVHAYEEWGADAFSRLEGQFACALWDTRARRLVLVRDRVGILPLAYATAGGAVVFASEAKALFAGGRVEARIDPAALGELFTTWSIVAPRSVFAGVRTVSPGCAVTFDAEGNESELRYWRPDFGLGSSHDDAGPHDELVDALEERLRTAVQRRLRADVPVGAYLSGGLDSALLCRFGSRVTPDLQTFGISFADARFDESAARDRVVRLLGTAHHDELCTSRDLDDALADVVWSCESPLLRGGPVPFFVLARSVRAAGLKTVLSGEGADELLAGYSIFKEDRVRRFWAEEPTSSVRPELLTRLHPYVAGASVRQTNAWKAFFAHALEDVDDPFYSHRIRWRNNAWTLRVLSPDVRGSLDPDAVDAAVSRSLPEGWRGWPALERAQVIELQTFMSSYLLSSQGDRVAMANGVEVRYPYLDGDVVDLCLRLPRSAKLRGLRDKVALRRVAARVLPADVAGREKQAYRAPFALAAWLSTEAGLDLLSSRNVEHVGLLDDGVVRRLAARIHDRAELAVGEREEMAMLGAVTVQLLAGAFLDDFGSRARGSLERLARLVPRVRVDNRSVTIEGARV